jgi:hypothetical protein
MTSIGYDEYPRYEDDECEAPNHNPYDENHAQQHFRSTLHFHVSTSSSDCDGPLYRDYVELPLATETSVEFFARVMLVNCARNTAQVTLEEDGEWVIRHHAPTEDGYHAEEWRSCVTQECRGQKSTQRDVFAEAAGY